MSAPESTSMVYIAQLIRERDEAIRERDMARVERDILLKQKKIDGKDFASYGRMMNQRVETAQAERDALAEALRKIIDESEGRNDGAIIGIAERALTKVVQP